MIIYGDAISGNSYKIKLTATLLQINFQWRHVDILPGEARTPDFLALSPNGKVPLVELSDGRCLWESNAIINYLAEGTQLLPQEAYHRAQVQQWQFFEQYSHEP